MPLSNLIVGEQTQVHTHKVDARWIMAYAAALNDGNPKYLNTLAHTVIAHPVFPVCVEWPVILDIRNLAGSASLTQQESARGVHAAHDLHLLAPIHADDQLSTQATMIDVKAIKPGAAYTMQLDTYNQHQTLVSRTYQLGIYRGVEVEANPSVEVPTFNIPAPPLRADLAAAQNIHTVNVSIARHAAHTYTECARIWNPIHTDRAVAHAAGLPDIILHGTATLALAVTEMVNQYAGADPNRVTRLGGRFSAMVLMPSTITVRSVLVDNVITYEVLTDQGELAISGGFVVLRDDS